MIRRVLLAAMLAAPLPALAQAPAPAVPTTPVPATPVPATPVPSTPGPPPGLTQGPPPAEWQPRGSIELQALNKVTARNSILTGKVGETLHFGALTITAASCLARPADQKQDYAAFLDITDARANSQGFHAWMLASEPALSMLEDPLYDIRLAACRP